MNNPGDPSSNNDLQPDSAADSASSSGGNTPSVSKQQLLSGAPALTDQFLGQELAERYLITEMLGTGAMGVVYKARHKLLNREIAVKVLKREVSTDEVSRRRFEAEAMAASSLTHPNLIAVHDYGFTADGTPFLVMDYLEGESLAAVLKREKRLQPARLLNILKQVCAGLAHAHGKGLVHRDLKPNNIMLLKYVDGRDLVKIVDFGIAKPIETDQDLTQTGQIFGTPLYMSPEQCQGKKLDGRSDIYSVGCLLYRLLVGRPPFTGDNAVSTIVMHVKEPPPPIPTELLDDDVLRSLEPVLLKMLAKAPEDRYQSADELRADLEKIDQGQTLSLAEDENLSLEPAAGSKFLNPRMLIATTLGCLVVAMIIVGVVGATMFEQPKTSAAPTAESAPASSTSAAVVSGQADKQTSDLESPAGNSSAAPGDIPSAQPRGRSADVPPAQPAAADSVSTEQTAPARPQPIHRRAHAAKPHGIKAFFKKVWDGL